MKTTMKSGLHRPVKTTLPPTQVTKLKPKPLTLTSLLIDVLAKPGTDWYRIAVGKTPQAAQVRATNIRKTINSLDLPVEVAARRLSNGKGGVWVRRGVAKAPRVTTTHPAHGIAA